MKYCRKCGKQLNDGEVCDCTASSASQPPPRAPGMQPPSRVTQQQPPSRAPGMQPPSYVMQQQPPSRVIEMQPASSSPGKQPASRTLGKQLTSLIPRKQPPNQPANTSPPPQAQTNIAASAQVVNIQIMQGQANSAEVSYFDGGLLQLAGWKIAGFFVTLLTLGICAPWAMCMIYRWETKHTVIQGKRLMFTGTAIGLFGRWMLWQLLSIITLGIYSMWVGIAIRKWKTKHTIFQ